MIVVAASPSQYRFAPGALSFYDAATLDYMGCAATGVKPDGIERGFSDMLTRMTCSSVLTAAPLSGTSRARLHMAGARSFRPSPRPSSPAQQ